jgi:hypothetical protein
MSAPGCMHPGELERREDGRHCRECDALIYPAAACTAAAPELPCSSPPDNNHSPRLARVSPEAVIPPEG